MADLRSAAAVAAAILFWRRCTSAACSSRTARSSLAAASRTRSSSSSAALRASSRTWETRSASTWAMAFVSKAALLAISCCNAEAMAPEAAGGDGIGAAVAGAPVPAWELGVASAMTTIHTSSGNYCTPMLYPGHYTCGRPQLCSDAAAAHSSVTIPQNQSIICTRALGPQPQLPRESRRSMARTPSVPQAICAEVAIAAAETPHLSCRRLLSHHCFGYIVLSCDARDDSSSLTDEKHFLDSAAHSVGARGCCTVVRQTTQGSTKTKGHTYVHVSSTPSL